MRDHDWERRILDGGHLGAYACWECRRCGATNWATAELRSSGHLRWSEGTPPSPGAEHEHGVDCGCTLSVAARPIGTPTSIRQEVRIVWDGCVIALEEDVAEPWVTFHKAGDAEGWIERYRTGAETDNDHAYVIFDGT